MAVQFKTNIDEVEQIELFSIDDVSYTIPNKVRLGLQLTYARMLKEKDAEAAMMWFLEKLLGTEAYQALEEYPDLTPENLTQVFEIAAAIAFGLTPEEVAALGEGNSAKKA